MSEPIRVGLVGIGKIARDQHVPALDADSRFSIAATASRNAELDGVPGHREIAAMIAGGHDLDAVSICTPPQGRHAIAAAAIEAGLHVMLEKPPAATLGEIADLAARAEAKGVTLFASWHSREAAGVAPARAWLADKRITAARIIWKEDIRRWHPGQDWILAAGGFGVFDPGINALSILTRILPAPVFVEAAELAIPADRDAPIAATLAMRAEGAPITADLDFLQTGPQTWDIEVETDAGALRLAMGGAEMWIDGEPTPLEDGGEYPGLYARFAELIANRASDVDVTPLRLVADALLVGARREAAPFSFQDSA